MSFKAPVFTNKGKQLYASCLAGKNEIIFTNIKLGDGELMAQAIADLEDLVNPVKTIVLNDKKLIGNDQVLIRAVFKNIDIASGFYWREVGLYAQDPENPEDRSKDILFCYQNAGDTAEYIPSASSGLIDKILSMSLVVSDVNSVNVSFFSESYALKEDLDEQIALQAQSLDNHKKDVNAHNEVFAKYLPLTGGTLSGNLYLNTGVEIYGVSNTNRAFISGGERGNWGQSAYISLNGMENTDFDLGKGGFRVAAANSEGYSCLDGKANGSLTWQGHNIATTNGIKMQGHILKDTDDSELIIGGATVFNNGAYGAFRGVNFGVAEEAGSFAFKAQGDKQYFLKGTKDGSLKWDDKNLVRSVNGVNADNAGNVTITASVMPDYSSGINITSSLGQGKTWTAPKSGILIHTSLDDSGACYISHTNANVYLEYNLPNWIIYNNTASGDYQSAMAIVNKNLVVYGATNSSVTGTLMFYPFK